MFATETARQTIDSRYHICIAEAEDGSPFSCRLCSPAHAQRQMNSTSRTQPPSRGTADAWREVHLKCSQRRQIETSIPSSDFLDPVSHPRGDASELKISQTQRDRQSDATTAGRRACHYRYKGHVTATRNGFEFDCSIISLVTLPEYMYRLETHLLSAVD